MRIETYKPSPKFWLAFALVSQFALAPLVQATTIRQEINILDAPMTVGATQATSSEIIQLDTTKYSQPTYYFEVVASSTATSSVTLRRLASTTDDSIITIATGTPYTRYRSTAFTPPAATTTQYIVNVSGTTTGSKTVNAARIVIIDATTTITTTETQIEIGNNETGTSTATSTGALQSPKYWYYDSSKWDASPTFYAEVTYAIPSGSTATASSTTFTTPGNATWTSPGDVTSVTVNAWGAGGGGLDASATKGGGGGGGGAFVSSTVSVTPNTGYTVKVGTGGLESTAGTSSSFNGLSIFAAGGGTPSTDIVSSTGGLASNSSGTTKFSGGNGGAGSDTNDVSGGGGGAAGPDGAGANGSNSSGTSGGAGGQGDNGLGGAGGPGGDAVGGQNGSSSVKGGGGGGGGGNGSGGGQGGSPGAGGGGGEVCTPPQCQGADGQVILYYGIPTVLTATSTFVLQRATSSFNWVDDTIIVNAGTSTVPSRVRTAFTASSTYYYRIVGKTSNASVPYNIYNAKIVVVQDGLVDSIGVDAIDRPATFATGYTVLNLTNPIDTNGVVNSVEIYANADLSDVKVGTFFGSGTDYEPRDYETIGSVSAGSTQTFTGLNIDASVGDIIGIYYVGLMEASGGGFSGLRYKLGDQFSAGVQTYSLSANAAISLYGTIVLSVSYLEPQYLLANTKLSAGTSSQNFLTSWDSSEWNVSSSNFIHQVDAADNSTSSAGIYNSAGTLVTGSTVSSPDNVGTSTMTMFCAASNLDVKATTNNNDIYASRILVQVGQSGNACSSGGPTPPVPIPFIKFIGGFSKFIGPIKFR